MLFQWTCHPCGPKRHLSYKFNGPRLSIVDLQVNNLANLISTLKEQAIEELSPSIIITGVRRSNRPWMSSPRRHLPVESTIIHPANTPKKQPQTIPDTPPRRTTAQLRFNEYPESPSNVQFQAAAPGVSEGVHEKQLGVYFRLVQTGEICAQVPLEKASSFDDVARFKDSLVQLMKG